MSSFAVLFFITHKIAEIMNPMNFLINYIFANSRAEHYNIVDKQPLQNMAVIGSIASMNPALGLSLIEFQAKNSQNDVPVTNNTTVTTQNQCTATTVKVATLETLQKGIEDIKLQLASVNQATSSNTISNETIQKGIEDIKLQQNKLEEIVSNVIKNKISPSFLKSDDVEIERLTNEIKEKTFPYFIKQHVKALVNELEGFKEILNNKFIYKLEVEDKKIVDELKDVFATKEAVIEKLEAMKKLNNSPSLGSFMPLLLSMHFDSRISDLKNKLTAIEATSKAVVPTASATAPIIDKTTATPKPTSTKK